MKAWKFFLFCLTLSLGFNLPASAKPVTLDSVAVIVNNGVILQSDIDAALKTLKAREAGKDQPLPDEKVLHKQIIEKLIIDKIQAQEAKRVGIQINDEQLNKAIAGIAKDNDTDLAGLRQKLKEQHMDYAQFRERIRQEVAASEVRNAIVRRRINILPAEVDSLAQVLAEQTSATVQYKIGHIQLRVDNDQDKAKVEAEAKALVTKLKQGADFKKTAYTYSKGPKAMQGGDWGWMRKEEMPTIFADQIHLQGKGAIIGPFRSGVGFHILKIEDVKGLQNVSVTEVDARHILLKPSIILSDAGAKNQLNEFIRQIKSGETTFAKLAQQYSQDPGSASQGGDLGFHTPDIYVPEFRDMVKALPVGQISKPFKTVHGWHIVEVLKRRTVDRTEDAMKNKAYQILFNRKFSEEASAWIQELRASAYVEIMGDNSDEQN